MHYRTAITALALALESPLAAAQSACPRQAQVDAMEEQARQLRDRDDAGALALLQQAYATCHGARALGRMGLAEIALGRWLDADEHLRAAMAQRSDPWVSQTYANLEGQLRIVGEHLGSLDLPGTGGPAEVFVGERRAGSWPTQRPLRVEAGRVTFTVRAEGYAPVTRTVNVPAGGVARESVELVALAGGTTRELQAAGSTQRTLGWVAAGIAGAGLVLGLTWHGVRAQRVSSYGASVCGQPEIDEADEARCLETLREANDAPIPWIVAGYVTAGAFAVAALVLHLSAPPSRATRASARWVCGPGGTGRSLGCAVSF